MVRPLRTGVVSRVLAPSARSTRVLPLSSVTSSEAVAGGKAASMVRSNAAVGALTLPTASVTVTVKLCRPLLSASVVKLQLPSPSAVVVPSSVSPS
ncbi:hypothetical protein B2J69_17290 [Pantoea latae]|uniref:Uncharacterized protein n=1 Tax=Pantoea latae TaxID=1964541 RepID=A0A1V9DD46_9GAMM|nr:hypothetical protein B2J69_17290 [Pantoea latae]